MITLLLAFAPILVLMVIPLVIPVFGIGVGTLLDKASPRTHSDAEAVVIAAQQRSAEWRAEMEREREQAETAKKPA